MNILDRIIADKKKEVKLRKQMVPLEQLESMVDFHRPVISMEASLRSKRSGGIIAEFKRRSPSKGIINDRADVADVATGYKRAGAGGMSVLTDAAYFGGNSEDLREARRTVDLPLLRKDFIVDEYQLSESKALGADVILLIAANLETGHCHQLATKAADLGLEVLLELHSENELGHISEAVTMVGINNRDLKTFKVDLENSVRLASLLPTEMLKIAESGISDPDNIRYLCEHGFQGFLIGENFMKQMDPGLACKKFIAEIESNELSL
ncbi:MAG: indole-3-glycerol phosphate synthase TrpC [Bacteroidetes bacterium]|nr:indole-3-glycerol phosphate synthase TrpC [Bacteroidota bacterium]